MSGMCHAILHSFSTRCAASYLLTEKFVTWKWIKNYMASMKRCQMGRQNRNLDNAYALKCLKNNKVIRKTCLK